MSAWKSPPTSGTSGELALMRVLQENHVLYRTQVSIKTRFKEYAFIVDFLIPTIDVKKYLGLVVEVDGRLHEVTFGGRPAIRRKAKDEAKTACLEGEGYRVLRFKDSVVKKEPQTVIDEIRRELARD